MTQIAPTPDLQGLLQLVDRIFGIDRVLADTGCAVIEKYSAQSGPAYDGTFQPGGFQVQPTAIVKTLTELQCQRGLEPGD